MVSKTFHFELQGLKELDDMLRDLPKAMGKAVLRKALKKAAEPIRDRAKANVPHGDTWNLDSSIVIGTKLNKNQTRGNRAPKDAVEVYVGSTDPKAHLVEFGTQERYREGSRGATGAMPSNPFLTKAWDGTKKQALNILTRLIAEELAKSAQRLRKKAEKGTLSKKAQRELL